MQFKQVSVFYNKQKPQNAPLASEVAAWLTAHGMQARVVTSFENLSASDLLICMGGDGVMLRCAREAAPLHIPILGINCGTLGFLAACEKDEFENTLTDLLAGNFTVQERIMLAVTVLLPEGKTCTLSALHACVLRADRSRALTVQASFNGRPLPPYFGDGVLVSTPTGSTAYALAAGGPIVAPGVDGLLITPICPHMLTQRPILLPHEGILELRPVLKTPLDGADLTLDGQENLTLPPGACVHIRPGAVKANLLMHPNRDFFTMLNRKLSWGSR